MKNSLLPLCPVCARKPPTKLPFGLALYCPHNLTGAIYLEELAHWQTFSPASEDYFVGVWCRVYDRIYPALADFIRRSPIAEPADTLPENVVPMRPRSIP